MLFLKKRYNFFKNELPEEDKTSVRWIIFIIIFSIICGFIALPAFLLTIVLLILLIMRTDKKWYSKTLGSNYLKENKKLDQKCKL